MFSAFIMIATLGFIYFLSSKMLQGKNWARITFLVMMLLSIYTIMGIPKVFEMSVVLGVFSVIQYGLQYYAACLLAFDRVTKAAFKSSNVTEKE